MSSGAGGSIRYLPTEIQSRFEVWASTPSLAMEAREKAWAAYVDARDNLSPGTTEKTTKARAQGESPAPSKLYRIHQ